MKLLIRFIWGLILIILGVHVLWLNLTLPITTCKIIFILSAVITICNGYFKIDKI